MSGECDKCGEHALECICLSKNNLIYIPPLTTTINVELTFPWMGKEYKIKKIPFRSVF